VQEIFLFGGHCRMTDALTGLADAIRKMADRKNRGKKVPRVLMFFIL